MNKKIKEIAKFISQFNNKETITLRALPKIYNLLKISPNHWQALARELLA